MELLSIASHQFSFAASKAKLTVSPSIMTVQDMKTLQVFCEAGFYLYHFVNCAIVHVQSEYS